MATTVNLVNELFKETVALVSQDSNHWQLFLKTASMNYTNSFSDQLLIYAQRPEAVACADIDTWNNTYKRYVNRGIPGIGLLTDYGNRIGIRYVWGVNETHSIYGRNGKKLRIWKVPKDYEEQVIKSLENKFGELSNKENFVEAIKSLAVNLAEDNYLDYFNDLIKNKTGTRLQNIDNDEIEKHYKELLKNSIAYMIINRSGINPDSYFNSTDFINIPIFQDIDSIARLGSAASSISELGIREIYVSLKNIRITEIDEIRTFDKKVSLDYDSNTKANIAERSDNYEHDLQKGWKISSTQFSDIRGTNSDGQIRSDEARIFEGKQERNLRGNENERDFDDSFERNRTNISNEDRNNHERDESETWNNRGIESYQSNEVDRIDEQHQESSRGDSSNRASLQLEDSGNTLDSIPFSDDKKYLYRLGDHAFIENEEYIIQSLENFEVFLYHPASPLGNRTLSVVEFENFLSNYEENHHLLVDYEKDGRSYQTVTKVEDITENNYHVIARVMNDNNCVELHSNKGKISTEVGIKDKDGSWNNQFLSSEWFNKNLTDQDILNKLEEIFNHNFSREQENYYGEYNDEIDLISHILHVHKIDDIVLNFDENSNLIAMDDENIWYGKEFYNFLFDDLFNYNEDGSVNLVDNKDLTRLKEYRKKYEDTTIIEETLTIPTEKEKTIVPKQSVNQLTLFATREQELADRIVDELNKLDTKYKGSFYVEDIELKPWEHIKSNKRNLTISIKSSKCTSYSDKENAFTCFNTDKSDEIILRESVENNTFLKYLSKDSDFSISLTPDVFYVFYSKFDEKQIDLSVGRNEVLSSINDKENIEVIDNPEIIIPKVEKQPRNRLINYVLHPEVPYEERNNYKITDDNLGVGTEKEKYHNNIMAIKVLKKCESENRYATPEEQEILSKYVGWGGLSQAFDKSKWNSEYEELKSILTPEEYSKARDTVTTAFYTPPVVIKAMYKALSKMGLDKGNILEPSCGIGNFIGLLPNNEKLKIYGVEIDDISGRIARQLYQKSSIEIKGFEKTNYPNSFFDVAIGNVPFGLERVYDKKYDKNNFLVHDYFFAKTIDKVRPGGIIAFVTSKGTLDKENIEVRKYIAQRANLLGAIRLPNNTFQKNAGTVVTSDIIFLQKRDSITDIMPNWVYTDKTEDNVHVNKYFMEHPEMVLGELKTVTNQFNRLDTICVPYENATLTELLDNAISNIHAEIKEYQLDELTEEDNSIEADINVRNFSYTVNNNKIYYRENSRMYPQDLSVTTENRIKGLIELRDIVREIIELQLNDYPDEEIKIEQEKLNKCYDRFTKKYGLINNRANASAFSDDSSYFLLCSLEILDEDKNLLRKADIFTKRTIKPYEKQRVIENANDALIVSLSERGRVDLDYIQSLYKKSLVDILDELTGKIFLVPSFSENLTWETADQYLSGNVRQKLRIAREFALDDYSYNENVEYLEKVIPKDILPSEISVRLGATWIPEDIIKDFMIELLELPMDAGYKINVHFSESSSTWKISNKHYYCDSIPIISSYGTKRANAYRLLEDALNLRNTKIFDYEINHDGNKVAVLNSQETAIAQAKQDKIKNEFINWVWEDVDRRDRLSRIYNERFNAIRNREYDGSHITFHGINPEIKLRQHQVNAIARILYGGNTLLAHEVGAGKTFTMVAAAMESKRLGLCNKSLFVVPNHIIEQFASEFLQLYPSANILVSTKKDFEKSNRKKFCSKIATGEYDAVIIGHSQFEKIPISFERQEEILKNQLEDIVNGIDELKANRGDRLSIKSLVRTKKSIEKKLEKLNKREKKDDVICFEELGVDRLFVDEAHYYKNLFLYTKMQNVGGIAQNEAQKSSDLFLKCRYLDEITGNKGVVFATGTPVSNTMAELYTMQRYLQYDTLSKHHLEYFDSWASTFGETVSSLEIAPEGTGYRSKTRFAKFYNLPELMTIFREVADIQTADMLKLPVPKAKYETVVIKPSQIQLDLVKSFSERAEKIRNKQVKSNIDNMLKITNDGRKLSLDQRLINELLPDDDNSKVTVCSNNIFKIWQESKDKKSTQLVFCDLSTPKTDGSFNVYDDIRGKLIEKGIPECEIEFIHNAKNDTQKQELFQKVRKGNIRILIGSTLKMGAGTNCQDKLIAIHHLDCPWLPSWFVQRDGRGIRQGNENDEVCIYRYVTEKTFDAYLFQLVENKQKFISQIMTSKTPLRAMEDIDETTLSYAEVKALAVGNPLIVEKIELDNQVSKLKLLKQNHNSEQFRLEEKVKRQYPEEINEIETIINKYSLDLDYLKKNNYLDSNSFCMLINGTEFYDKQVAGKQILELCKNLTDNSITEIGLYKGFKMKLEFNSYVQKYRLHLENNSSYILELGNSDLGNITRIENLIGSIENKLEESKSDLEQRKIQLEKAKKELGSPFALEDELTEAINKLKNIEKLLKLDEKQCEIVEETDEVESDRQCFTREYER